MSYNYLFFIITCKQKRGNYSQLPFFLVQNLFLHIVYYTHEENIMGDLVPDTQ